MSGPHFDLEREAMRQGFARVAGVDEVGRGPLAGPVGVAAVILDPDDLPDGLDNSKALPEVRRDALKPIILAKAISVAVAFASAEEIDRYNIRGATLRAMARAVRALAHPAGPRPDRRTGRARRRVLSGSADRRRRRAVSVDRRRLDHR